MLNIKEITVTAALENGIVPLQFEGKTMTGGKEIYAFVEGEHKIRASVTLESEDNVIIAAVAFHKQNHPFRENFNLTYEAPLRITVTFEKVTVKMCALYQHKDWWSRPAFLDTFEDLPERTQSLFIQGEKQYGYILPMVGDKMKTYLSKGSGASLTFDMTAYIGGMNQINDVCFLLSEGGNLFEITERVFRIACQLKGIPMKADRSFPEMFDYIGWCSWDAFYTDINEEKVLRKVEEFKLKQIPVRWILLDDGWLNVRDQCLASFEPDPTKFPQGFNAMTKKIKEETLIQWVGVWHAFAGYWGGIAPDSKVAEKTEENLYQTINGKLLPHYQPDKGFGFWSKWYVYLKAQGIDFVKVDGQSALKNYYKNNEEIAKVAKGAHTSLEAAVDFYMNGNIINCMGMAMENVLSRHGTCISRNSDDFMPNEENGFREHVLQNAYNALYHDNVYACDWDMFWTNHPDAGKHALIRAISGGPVYVSDRIGETVPDEILPLIYHDGRLLRMDRSAKPANDCIFNSPLKNRALKLTNTVNNTGVVAAFHISETNEAVEAELSPSDIYDLKGEVFGAYLYFKKEFLIIRREEALHVTLTEKGYELALFIPLGVDVTPIGLINKYMSSHALECICTMDDRTSVTLTEGGNFAFYKADEPKSISVNGTDRTDQVIRENGFYSVDLSGFTEKTVVTIR